MVALPAGILGTAAAQPDDSAWNAAHAAAHYEYQRSLLQAHDEATIRALEDAGFIAELARGVGARAQAESGGFTAEAAGSRTQLNPSIVLDSFLQDMARYASFERTIEQLDFNGNAALVRGTETLWPAAGDPLAGRGRRRSFTNLWVKDEGRWTLLARDVRGMPPD